ncbi:MAG TPA: GDSL-type esterase/lipase family protein [Azoarcus taiwanensis]|nr:GDSL-type esterase/lipase family protein [Azoarcus taiwanensis]
MACDHVDIEAERQERLPKIMAGGRQKARLRIVRPRVVDDCLVAGTGATHEQSWPAVLAQRTGWTVVSAGVPGDTSEAALLETHRPDALIIAVGGNDFLRNVPPDHTRAQLEEMTRLSRSAATRVAIMAVPRVSAAGSMFGTLSDHALFAEFAQARGVVLVPGAIAGGGGGGVVAHGVALGPHSRKRVRVHGGADPRGVGAPRAASMRGSASH